MIRHTTWRPFREVRFHSLIYFYITADQTRWHRVVVALDLDVIVGRNPALLPFGILVGFARQPFEGRPLDRFQQLEPADAELAHDAAVEIGDDLPDCRIELEQREETPV